MSTTASKSFLTRYAGVIVIILWAATFVAARLALDKELDLQPTALRVAAALLPVLPTVLCLWYILVSIGRLDEMQRRIHLEALAIAFPLALLLLMTLGLLQLAIPLPEEDWSYRHVWAFLPLFYVIGLTIAWWRYS
jgi:hypothetical protein